MKEMLRLTQITKSFDVKKGKVEVFDGLDLTVEEGDFVCIVGYSGCGKSTLLRLISGLISAERGDISICGQKISDPQEFTGMMFQEPRLLPWLTVLDNVAFGLGGKKQERRAIAFETLKRVGMETLAVRYPASLSGGMAQRVALARALAPSPRLLLLDEPLGSLDALTRAQMQDELLSVHLSRGLTTVMVTHDVEEAVYLSNRIIVLGGRPAAVAADILRDKYTPREKTSAEFLSRKKAVLHALASVCGSEKEIV